MGTRAETQRELGECQLWGGAVFAATGYGQVRYNGRSMTAHRAALIEASSNTGDGLDACHACDNRLCVKALADENGPAHLFWGTRGDNMRDARAKGRMSTGPAHAAAVKNRARGERNGRSRLTEEAVRAIRRLLSEGRSHRSIAADFDVAHRTIGLIGQGRRWAHVAERG